MLFDQFKQVKAFVFAIEGVCTDGNVWVSNEGEQWFRLHSKDCYAMQSAVLHYPVALVGDVCPLGIVQLMERMGVTVLLNSADKSAVADWMSGKGLAVGHVLCMGSDIADLDCMALAGFGTCPADAVEDVRAASAYVSHCRGGSGAVRDVVEKVMKLQGTWNGNIIMQSV